MVQPFKNGPSLHRLLDQAPLGVLSEFFRTVEGGVAAEVAGSVDAIPAGNLSDAELREHLLDAAGRIAPDVAARLEHHAQRIVTLGEGRGTEALTRMAEGQLGPDLRTTYDAQQDDLGRSTWTYLHARAYFEDAESLFYANHYRNFGRMYDAFELAVDAATTFVWSVELQAALETRIKDALALPGRCTVTCLAVPGNGDNGSDIHLLIVRHGGPLSSVAEFQDDGRKGMHYYRPPNEATLLFSPEQGLIEVFAPSPGLRQQLAVCFAETGLGHDLSKKPLTLKQYNLSRFLTSLMLPVISIDGFDIDNVAVVEVDARPDNPKHRASLKVTADDDIEAVARTLFGQDHIFRHAVAITRVVIATRYTRHGDARSKTLNISLSDPNKCNLRSNRDPAQRQLGDALLTAWGILRPVKLLDMNDERALFPALLAVFDQATDLLPGRFFLERGLDIEALADGGFIERRGRYKTLLLDGDTGEVDVRSAGRPGWVCYDSPADGGLIEIPGHTVDKYEVKIDWVEEMLVKHLKPDLATFCMSRLDSCLIQLGTIQLAGAAVPCYLARGLGDPQVLKRQDGLLRARGGQGIGVILAAGTEHPLCLGPNVVMSLSDHLNVANDGVFLSSGGLTDAFTQGRQMARGGMTVELVENDHTATLYIPGKAPYTLIGANQIMIFRRLVAAYHQGSPAVLTADLIAGTSAQSPSQAFRDWKKIVNVYVGQSGKRGSWQLIV